MSRSSKSRASEVVVRRRRQPALAGIARSLLGAVGVSLTLRSLLAAYVLIVAVAASLNAYASVRLVRYRLDFVDALRERLYRAVAAAEWKHLLSLRQSDVLSTITMNVSWVSLGVLASLKLAVTAILVVVQLAVALRISPLVTALAAGTGGALIAITWPLVARSRRLGREQVDNNRGVLASVTGFLDGLKLAKAHGLEAGHVGTFGEAIRRSRRSQIDFTTAQSISTAVQLVVTSIVLAILVSVAVQHFPSRTGQPARGRLHLQPPGAPDHLGPAERSPGRAVAPRLQRPARRHRRLRGGQRAA